VSGYRDLVLPSSGAACLGVQVGVALMACPIKGLKNSYAWAGIFNHLWTGNRECSVEEVWYERKAQQRRSKKGCGDARGGDIRYSIQEQRKPNLSQKTRRKYDRTVSGSPGEGELEIGETVVYSVDNKVGEAETQ